MLEDASNQELLATWQQGDERAAQVLVQRYMLRLMALARSRLSRKLSRRLDPEDIVLSAWRSFFVATGNGQLGVPEGDDLWPLLVTLTVRKLARQTARHRAQRRDFENERNLDLQRDWQSALSRDPTPDEAAMLADEVESLMAMLDPFDREILTRRLQGADQAAIALALDCSDRTVRRSLRRIRDAVSMWNASEEGSPKKMQSAAAAGAPLPAIPSSGPTEIRPELQPTIPYSDIVLKKLIGQGGVGKVYFAEWSSEGSPVAVKYLKKRFWKDPRATQSLLNETTRLAGLSHPNIIRHHGWGCSPGGAVFVVMEWIEGSNAHQWNRAAHPSLSEILECGAAIAGAVAAAHAAGIVHGDLTPGNVLRRRDGEFILTDFGFARSLRVPVHHDLGGTPGFLAPEQISDAFGPISERTDVYGLGGLVYSLLTREPPMTGCDIPEILAHVISSRPPQPPGAVIDNVPPELDRLLLRCLSKEPSERPPSVAEVEEALRAMWAVL